MPKYKFILVRAAIVDEYYEVEADSEEQALEMAFDGDLPDPCRTDFLDWRDDTYECIEKEEIEPLYRMVKDYKSVDKLEQ